MAQTAKLGADVVALVCSGVAVLVATRSDDRRLEVMRGWGLAVSSDCASLSLCVPAPRGSIARSNLEGNGEVALFVRRSADLSGVAGQG